MQAMDVNDLASIEIDFPEDLEAARRLAAGVVGRAEPT